MKNFLILLNGVIVADYYTRGRAENAFARYMHRVNEDQLLELFDVENSRTLATNW